MMAKGVAATARSAGSMKAIRPPAQRSVLKTIGRALRMLVLMVTVTGVGLIAGAFIMSPEVSHEERVLALMALAALLAAFVVTYVLMRLISRMRSTLSERRQRRLRAAASMASGRNAVANRTPKHVQALAASGAQPVEIACKTRLPVDAVAMLLKISGPAIAAR